jgi:hypothetical protein
MTRATKKKTASRPGGRGAARKANDRPHRARSPRLRRALEAFLRDELRHAAAQPISTLLPPTRARRLVRDFAPEALSDKALAVIAVRVRRDLEKQLRATRRTPAEMLGADFAERAAQVFDEELLDAEAGEELIAHVLRQEFVRKLLTEVVHTSIVSFYKRVNPLFGGLATTMLDDQIRGFINMFMPMIQEQAVRFAAGKRSQAFARDLARSLAHHTLTTPLAEQLPELDKRQRQRIERIVREAATSAALRRQTHAVAVIVWDAIYASIRDRKLGDVVDLKRLTAPLIDGGAELLAVILARPALVALLRRELAP